MSNKRLWFRFDSRTFSDREYKRRIIEEYDKGNETLAAYRAAYIEWSTDKFGRKFYYECPKCGHPMRHCPDPVCAEERVGHHLFEEYNLYGENNEEECKDEDIPYVTASRVYFPVLIQGAGPGFNEVHESEVKTPEEWMSEQNMPT